MTAKRDVAVFVGSLRKDSISRKAARALMAVAPDSLRLEIVEIGRLPLYNEDLEQSPPESWQELRERVKQADAVLFVTPEYNRSIPAVLKNAIDVASRPYGQNAWDGKPGAVVSVSPGAIGAFGAHHHLRQSMVFLNVAMMQQPEAYIGRAGKLFGPNGEINDPGTEEFLAHFMQSFADWIALIQSGRSSEDQDSAAQRSA